MRKSAYEGARYFSDETWLQKIFEGSTKKRVEYCKNEDGVLCYLRAIQAHLGGIPIEPELVMYLCLEKGKKYTFHRGLTFMELPVFFGKWTDSGRKEER